MTHGDDGGSADPEIGELEPALANAGWRVAATMHLGSGVELRLRPAWLTCDLSGVEQRFTYGKDAKVARQSFLQQLRADQSTGEI